MTRTPALPRILVADPNRSHQLVLARRLGAEGYRVVLADGGGNALAELHRGGADLLLAELR
jgi:CheY-like chemotaxis protein